MGSAVWWQWEVMDIHRGGTHLACCVKKDARGLSTFRDKDGAQFGDVHPGYTMTCMLSLLFWFGSSTVLKPSNICMPSHSLQTALAALHTSPQASVWSSCCCCNSASGALVLPLPQVCPGIWQEQGNGEAHPGNKGMMGLVKKEYMNNITITRNSRYFHGSSWQTVILIIILWIGPICILCLTDDKTESQWSWRFVPDGKFQSRGFQSWLTLPSMVFCHHRLKTMVTHWHLFEDTKLIFLLSFSYNRQVCSRYNVQQRLTACHRAGCV